MAVGVSDNIFELLRWFYVPFEDGADAVTPIITRAMAQIDELRHTQADTDTDDEDQADGRVDHLADIAEVLGSERRVRTQVVLTRLADLNPRAYEGWTFSDLRTALAEHGIEPGKSEGVKVVRAQDVTTALTESNHGEGDGDGEESGS